MSNILIDGIVFSNRYDYVNGVSSSQGDHLNYTPTGTPEPRNYTLVATRKTKLDDTDNYFFLEHKPIPQHYTYPNITAAITANHSFLPGDKIIILNTGQVYYNKTATVKDFAYIFSRKDVRANQTYKLPVYQCALNLPTSGTYNFEIDCFSWRNPSEPDERKYYFPDESFTYDINLISIPEGSEAILKYTLQENLENVYDTRDTISFQIRLRNLDYNVITNREDGSASVQSVKNSSIRTAGEFSVVRIYRPFGSSDVYCDYLPDNTNV